MSKGGGAGKVYFVLYLAVVLELLIIIVERDEAEEGLLKKQRESMKIVESILSQMQAGAGTEGINTRPQDEITILDKADEQALGDNIKIKSSRKYIVEVGVTDISNDLKRQEGESGGDYQERLKKLVELANVDELEYQVFYNNSSDPNNTPNFPTDNLLPKIFNSTKDSPGKSIQAEDGSNWEFVAIRKLKLDKDGTYNKLDLANLSAEAIVPLYPPSLQFAAGPSLVPTGMPEDSSFFYSIEESYKRLGLGGGSLKKRAFVVNFQPSANKAGWYKLRFASRTNRILGVRGNTRPEEISDETKINIGTVQLTVGALNKVKKELTAKLEKYGLPAYETLANDGNIDEFERKLAQAKDNASKESGMEGVEIKGKIDLYGYICKLLAPGQSSNFSQNRGAIEFNIRVLTPKPQTADPTVTPTGEVACFDKIPAAFDFSISPFQGEGKNNIVGKIVSGSGSKVADVICKPNDKVPPVLKGKRDYIGEASSAIDPGQYTIEITHNLSGKTKTETIPLTIFPTKLTDASFSEINGYMASKTTYGNNLIIKAIPSSGGKIRSETFRIDLKTDKDSQKQPFAGLSMATDSRVALPPDASKASLRIWWEQPFTGRTVDLYPEQVFDIRQAEPKIITDGLSTIASGTTKRFRVTIKGIQLSDPSTGDPNKKPNLKFKVSDAKSDIAGFEINGEPSYEGPSDGKYSVTLDLIGQLARGEDMVSGQVSFNITASANNPINGKNSKDNKKRVSANVNFEPEKEGGKRSGGGARPTAPKQPSGKKK